MALTYDNLRDFIKELQPSISEYLLGMLVTLSQRKQFVKGQQLDMDILRTGFMLVYQGELLVLGNSIPPLKRGGCFGAHNIGTGFKVIQDTTILLLPPQYIKIFDSTVKRSSEVIEAMANPGGIRSQTSNSGQEDKQDADDERTRTNVAFKQASTFSLSDRVTAKTAGEEQYLLHCLADLTLFDGMSDQHRLKVVKQMWKEPFKKGDVVIKQGDVAENFYVIEKGKFEVLVATSQDGVSMKKIGKSLRKGSVFGELALVFNTPRACTVRCRANGVTWILDRYTFRAIMTNLSSQKMEQIECFLEKVPLLTELDSSQRHKIAEAVEESRVADGQVVCRAGDPGDCLYIVHTGEVRVMNEQNKEIRRYKTGEYFGERALLNNEPRSLSCFAVGKTELFKIDKAAYVLLLSDIEKRKLQRQAQGQDVLRQAEKLAKAYANTGESFVLTAADAKQLDLSAVQRLVADNSVINDLYQYEKKIEKINEDMFTEKIRFEDLEPIGVLGTGSFGTVKLVKNKITSDMYALKMITRHRVHETEAHENILNEKLMADKMHSAFIVKLFATYTDKEYLYLLQEPAMGGELFEKLRKSVTRRFDNNTARFYVASVVLAFEHMHSLDIIYRDLKPENVLLDGRGYAKISDLGFAKQIPKGRTWTLCGTPAYLAPELLASRPHGKGVDWWCVGIFAYELLAGRVPFRKTETPEGRTIKLFENIMKNEPVFPDFFKPEAADIIRQFIIKKPLERLGVRHGVDEIKRHPWFSGFDWDELAACKMRAPIIPFIDDSSEKDMILENFGEKFGRKEKGKEPSFKEQDYGDAFALIDKIFNE